MRPRSKTCEEDDDEKTVVLGETDTKPITNTNIYTQLEEIAREGETIVRILSESSSNDPFHICSRMLVNGLVPVLNLCLVYMLLEKVADIKEEKLECDLVKEGNVKHWTGSILGYDYDIVSSLITVFYMFGINSTIILIKLKLVDAFDEYGKKKLAIFIAYVLVWKFVITYESNAEVLEEKVLNILCPYFPGCTKYSEENASLFESQEGCSMQISRSFMINTLTYNGMIPWELLRMIIPLVFATVLAPKATRDCFLISCHQCWQMLFLKLVNWTIPATIIYAIYNVLVLSLISFALAACTYLLLPQTTRERLHQSYHRLHQSYHRFHQSLERMLH